MSPQQVWGCPLAPGPRKVRSAESPSLRPFLRFPASLILSFPLVPVLLFFPVHLSLPLSSLGKSVETTFRSLAPPGSSSVWTSCPGRRSLSHSRFPVGAVARSVHTCQRGAAAAAASPGSELGRNPHWRTLSTVSVDVFPGPGG